MILKSSWKKQRGSNGPKHSIPDLCSPRTIGPFVINSEDITFLSSRTETEYVMYRKILKLDLCKFTHIFKNNILHFVKY